MASISSPGLGSGLDVKSIVSQLVALERKPIDALNTRTESLQGKLSAFGLVQSYLVNLQDAAGVLAKASTWQQTKASSADATSVSVSSSTTAQAGSYAVEVSQLAQAQSLASPVYTSSTASMGTGTLRIELGSWNTGNTAFTPKSGTSGIDIAIPAGADSLEAVRTAINAANAGVSASIVRDAAGARLAIRSTSTGQENAVRITATANPATTPGGPTLNDLVYNPAVAPSTMTQTMAARDAMATVNGLPVTSPRNSLSEVIEGLTITLNKVTTTPTQLTVSTDTTAMRKAVDDFTKAYNDINKYISEQTKYDEDSKVAGTLQGDRATLSLQSQLRSMMGSLGGASTRYARLSDLGVQIQADGSLKVNDAKFNDAVSAANLSETARAFSQDTGTASTAGFAVRIKALATQMTNSDGVVSTRSAGLQASIKRNADEVKRQEDRVAMVEARLNKQYSALDTSVSKLKSLGDYVSQQITTWNKSS